MQMTRRKLAAAISAAAAVAAAGHTEPQAETAPDELVAARDRMRRNSDDLEKHQIPMSVEPAFQFKV